jgi:hypothetical protein
MALFIERGSAIEASMLQQVRQFLPPEIASQINFPANKSAQSTTDYTESQLDRSPIPESAAAVRRTSGSVTSGNGSAGPAPMPTTDARAAAALTELSIAVQDLQVCNCSDVCHAVQG